MCRHNLRVSCSRRKSWWWVKSCVIEGRMPLERKYSCSAWSGVFMKSFWRISTEKSLADKSQISFHTRETYSVSAPALLMRHALFHGCYRINRLEDCWYVNPFAKWRVQVQEFQLWSNLLVWGQRDHSLGRKWASTPNLVEEFVDIGTLTTRRSCLGWKNRFHSEESWIRGRYWRVKEFLLDEKSQDLKRRANERIIVLAPSSVDLTLRNCLCSAERENVVVLPYFDLNEVPCGWPSQPCKALTERGSRPFLHFGDHGLCDCVPTHVECHSEEFVLWHWNISIWSDGQSLLFRTHSRFVRSSWAMINGWMIAERKWTSVFFFFDVIKSKPAHYR